MGVAGQVLQKTNMEGGLPKKGRLGQFVDLGGGGADWQESRDGVLEEADTPMHTISYPKII